MVENNDDGHNNIQTNEKEEDYISSSMLGSLLVAQCKTDNALNAVPKGSVKVAKLQTSPSRPKNTGHSKDWYGPKHVITEEVTNSGMPNKGGSNVFEVDALRDISFKYQGPNDYWLNDSGTVCTHNIVVYKRLG